MERISHPEESKIIFSPSEQKLNETAFIKESGSKSQDLLKKTANADNRNGNTEIRTRLTIDTRQKIAVRIKDRVKGPAKEAVSVPIKKPKIQQNARNHVLTLREDGIE